MASIWAEGDSDYGASAGVVLVLFFVGILGVSVAEAGI